MTGSRPWRPPTKMRRPYWPFGPISSKALIFLKKVICFPASKRGWMVPTYSPRQCLRQRDAEEQNALYTTPFPALTGFCRNLLRFLHEKSHFFQHRPCSVCVVSCGRFARANHDRDAGIHGADNADGSAAGTGAPIYVLHPDQELCGNRQGSRRERHAPSAGRIHRQPEAVSRAARLAEEP